MKRSGIEESRCDSFKIPPRDVSASLDMTKVLVIADTHNKLPPIICEVARGADEIWHLGDVCDDWVLEDLQFLGPPVTLVRGNCDDNYNWPFVRDLTRNGIRFRLEHICPPPHKAPADYDILLHGHTHVPRDETIAGVLFLNPGCAHGRIAARHRASAGLRLMKTEK